MTEPGRSALPPALSPRPRGRPRRVRRDRIRIAVAWGVALVVVASAVGVVVALHARSVGARHRRIATATATDFLRTWAAGDIAALPGRTTTGSPTVSAAYAAADTALDIAPAHITSGGTSRLPLRFTVGTPTGRARAMVVPDRISIAVPGLGTWRYTDSLTVNTHVGRVVWTPVAIAPHLAVGDGLTVDRQVFPRAPLLSATGTALPQTADVAALLGAVTPATSPAAGIRVGDLVGVSGLERQDDAQLRGAAAGAVTVTEPAGQTVATLARFTGRRPVPQVTTLHSSLQALAESTIAGSAHPTALVALDANTGAVLAAASNPPGYPLSVVGRLPPGSTFKMVTLTAALMSGLTLASPTQCTPTVTVDGYAFHNASGESFGTIPLERAFAVSCNTAFIHVAETLPAGALTRAAQLLGCDTGHAPLASIASYGCSYPTGATGTAYAASAIGQGTVLTSPLAVAAIDSAIDSGTWNQPHIRPGPARASHPLPASVDAQVQQGMRAVVTSGTGTPADLPGQPVYGKTGTAEFGTGPHPPTDAWFAAYRGPIAVAVAVQDGGFGEQAAAPLAATFLARATLH